MLAVLRTIRQQTDRANSYLGNQQAELLRQGLGALPEGSNDARSCKMRLALANEELRLGNEQAAIEHLSWLHDQISILGSRLPESFQNEIRFRLGVAYLRFGETQNCCLRNTPESCILPLRGEGVHTRKEGSQKAIENLTEVLQNVSASTPVGRRAMWLLNIAYMTLGDYPEKVPGQWLIPPSVFQSEVEFPSFENIAVALNVNSFDMCGGVILEDFDNDHDLDIVTSTYDTHGGMHYFENNADGTFSERTKQAGLSGMFGGLNMVQADFNNDGYPDILVLRGAWWSEAGRHPNSLLRNQGDGTFRDVTFEAGLADTRYPTQTAAWADYDNDGDLDLYIGNEHLREDSKASPCQLFRNNGDETFTDVTEQAGVANRRFAKGVVWGDYDNDRFPDIYVSNLGEANRLYHNNGDGTFTDVAVELGVDSPTYSFPVWFWDVDNDGALDLFVSSYNGVTGMVAEVASSYLGESYDMDAPRLYRGDGQGKFVDVAKEYGLTQLLMPMGANFGDLNGDGFLDFYLGTGYPDYEALMPNVMYLNQQGNSFTDVTSAGRFGHLQKGHGIAFADLDHDGDQDVFAQMGGAYPGDKFANALYENPGFDNHWIAIQLVGEESNRSAIGARIRVVITSEGQTRSIYKHVNSGGSFGANPLRQTIGLGNTERIERLEIYWPKTDRTQVFNAVSLDQIVRIDEDADEIVVLPCESFTMPAAE